MEEDVQPAYTMDKHQLAPNPYHYKVLRTDMQRAIPSYIPDIVDESILAMKETFSSTESGSQYRIAYATRTQEVLSGSTGIPVFHTMTYLIARISNRVIFGEGLCRNKKFIHAVVHYAEGLPTMALLLKWSPPVLRP